MKLLQRLNKKSKKMGERYERKNRNDGKDDSLHIDCYCIFNFCDRCGYLFFERRINVMIINKKEYIGECLTREVI